MLFIKQIQIIWRAWWKLRYLFYYYNLYRDKWLLTHRVILYSKNNTEESRLHGMTLIYCTIWTSTAYSIIYSNTTVRSNTNGCITLTILTLLLTSHRLLKLVPKMLLFFGYFLHRGIRVGWVHGYVFIRRQKRQSHLLSPGSKGGRLIRSGDIIYESPCEVRSAYPISFLMSLDYGVIRESNVSIIVIGLRHQEKMCECPKIIFTVRPWDEIKIEHFAVFTMGVHFLDVKKHAKTRLLRTLYCTVVFGHFWDPPGNHPRGAIFSDGELNQSINQSRMTTNPHHDYGSIS